MKGIIKVLSFLKPEDKDFTTFATLALLFLEEEHKRSPFLCLVGSRKIKVRPGGGEA